MATLKIYSDIQTGDEQSFMRLTGASEGVTFRDIDDFVDSMAEDDTRIDLRLHCDGGSVTEGWAIYDRLRMSGKEITATVEGTCASMATVILMAAPKERRYAYANAHILLHNPYIATMALGEMATADELTDAGENLRREQNKMVDLYVERTGCDRDELVSLMEQDKFIDADEALRLGIIGKILPPITAKKRDIMEVKANLIQRMLAKLGVKSLEEVEAMETDEAKAMTLNAENGTTINVEREDGAPQVGDIAQPDGEWVMDDGSVIVIENGVITEIRTADATAGEDVSEDGKKGDDEVTEVDERDDELQRLRDRIAELEKENEELRQRVAEEQAKAKTEDEERLLGLLDMAGGESALARITSDYVPEPRQPKGAKASAAVMSAAEIIDKYNKVYGKK